MMTDIKETSYLTSFFLVLAVGTTFRVLNDWKPADNEVTLSITYVNRIANWLLFYAILVFLFVFILSPSKSHSFYCLQSRPYTSNSKLNACVLSFFLSFLHPFVQENFFSVSAASSTSFGLIYFLPAISSFACFQIISIQKQPLLLHSSHNIVYQLVTNIWSPKVLLAIAVASEISIFGIAGLYFASAQLFALVFFLSVHYNETAEKSLSKKSTIRDRKYILSSRLVYLFLGLSLFTLACGCSLKNNFKHFSGNEKNLSNLFWVQVAAYVLSLLPVQMISYVNHIVEIVESFLTAQKVIHVNIIQKNNVSYFMQMLTEALLHQPPIVHKLLFLWESFACLSQTLAVCTISTVFPVGFSSFLLPPVVSGSITGTSTDSFTSNLNFLAKRSTRRSKRLAAALSENNIHLNPSNTSINLYNMGQSQFSAQLQQLNISQHNPVSLGDSTMIQQVFYFVAPLILCFCFYKSCRACSSVFLKAKNIHSNNVSLWIVGYISFVAWSGAVLSSGILATKDVYDVQIWLGLSPVNFNNVIIAMFQKSLSVWLLVFLVNICAPILSDLMQYYMPRRAEDGSNITIVASHHHDKISTEALATELDINDGFLGAHHLQLRPSSTNSWMAKIITNLIYTTMSYYVIKQILYRYIRTNA